ncbi:MAG TPA: GGDEF domain-containing protein, partial [Phycisphaerae bacterium]|nr:GGDEF domain-containing protein [Phycisphaerae bacterium]
RSGANWAAVMIDVDHFKRFNDDHGHQAGDEVLRQVGASLGRIVRASDSVGRYGGEEFMFVLGGVGEEALEGAEIFAERVRGAIEQIDVPGLPQVTASVGVAVALPGDSIDTVVARADEALYQAKEAGRNRAQVWGRRVA